jgi:hypothetical protein
MPYPIPHIIPHLMPYPVPRIIPHIIPRIIPHITPQAVSADLAEGFSPVLPLAAGCVHYGNKQDVGSRLALGVRRAVYGEAALIAEGPMVVSATVSATTGAASANITLFYGAPSGVPSEGLEVRNTSGFELSSDGAVYEGATITAHTDDSVTLMIPASMQGSMHGGMQGSMHGGAAVVSLRYILHDTPCVNKSCAIYGRTSGLPSPPLVANLPGHAGADPVGWNMSAAP